MIPKKIHYCWLSGEPYPELISDCIKTWHKYLPDFEFVLWDTTKININQTPWLQESFKHKKYAFAADYIRLYALYTEGGIYLDCDVQVVRNLSPLLVYNSFMGFDTNSNLEPAIIGAHNEMKWVKMCLDYYKDKSFCNLDGTFNMQPLPTVIKTVLNAEVHILDNIVEKTEITPINLTLFPTDYFSPKNLHSKKIKTTSNTYTIHHFDGHWLNKNWLYYIKLCVHTIIIVLLGQKKHNRFIKNIKKNRQSLSINWKVKAFIQNFIALFPTLISYELYFQMQRHWGSLKKPINPIHHFNQGIKIIKKIKKYGYNIDGKVFFEVGTGRAPFLPVTFWLCGAGKTITVDLNPYMRNEIINDMIYFIQTEENTIRDIFGNLLDKERFEILLSKTNINLKDILNLCQIEYYAPGDAAKTHLNNNSINYHVSHTVYEHIPLNILQSILQEGNRIITDDGLFINHIDYSDHFSYVDKNISPINFLQYSDNEWEKYAGNRYMYMNRARHDEFIELFKSAGHDFIEIEPNINNIAFDMLENNKISLDEKFKAKSNEILSITDSWFITKSIVLK
jgi:mannosyltransferase OCH1-like enzyme/SAM-dependent methyltransferase